MSQNRLPLKFNRECKAQRDSIESLYIALGLYYFNFINFKLLSNLADWLLTIPNFKFES